MKRSVKYKGLGDLRNLGKYISSFGDNPENYDILGKCFFASAAKVDRTRTDLEQDKQYVRILAKTLKQLIDNPSEIKNIEEDAARFSRICEAPQMSRIRCPSNYESLYSQLLEQCPEKGYFGLGYKIISASNSLMSKLPQANNQFLDQQAIMILQNYLR